MRLSRGLALLLLMLGAGGLWLLRGREEASARIVQAEIEGVHVAYPPAYARDPATQDGGTVERLAFLVEFPGFAPHRPPGAARAGLVFITVRPDDDAMDPAERPSQLYARFVQGDAEPGPGGLVIRRFEAGTPYELEALYVSPPDGRDFFARCLAATAKEEMEAAAGCLWLFRDGPLDVEVRFAPALLENWRAIASGARGFFAAMKTGRLATQAQPPAARR